MLLLMRTSCYVSDTGCLVLLAGLRVRRSNGNGLLVSSAVRFSFGSGVHLQSVYGMGFYTLVGRVHQHLTFSFWEVLRRQWWQGCISVCP